MAEIIKKVIRTLGYFLAGVIIIAGLLASIGGLLTPYFNDHLPDFEARATDILQLPVKIGSVKLSWSFYEPEILLRDITVLNATTHQPQVTIEHIKIDINVFLSLLHAHPILRTIKIGGLHLTVHQSTPDTFVIDELKNLNVANQAAESNTKDEIMTWIFAQSNVVVEEINIDYFLPSNNHKSIFIQYLALHNTPSAHTLGGNIILNQAVATKMKVDLEWEGRAVDFTDDVNLHVYLEGISLPQWFSQFSWHNLQIQEGLGSAKVWAKWNKKQLQSIKSQFQFYDIEYSSTLTHKSQEIPRLSGKINWQRDGANQVIKGENILIDLPEHLWPTTNFLLNFSTQADGVPHLQKVEIDYLDLADTSHIFINSGLVPEKIQTFFSGLNLTGEVHDLKMSMPADTNGDALPISLNAVCTKLSFNAEQNYPGVTNLSGKVVWKDQQGDVMLDSKKLSISLPQLFLQPLIFAQALGNIHLKKNTDSSWTLTGKKLQIQNADLTTASDVQLTIPATGSPTINLSADFSMAKANNISHYLPSKLFSSDLVQWLHTAFVSGQIGSGKVLAQGNLTDFPFESGNGKFSISGAIQNLDFNYAPGWPHIEKLNGTLTFSGSSMTADINSGNILGVPLTGVHGVIPYLGESAPQILTVQSTIQTDFAHGLKFIHQSPLEKTVGKNIAGLEMTGPVALKLNLVIPLSKPDATTVQGNVDTTHAELNLSAFRLKLSNLTGSFQFTEQGISANKLTGNLFNEPINLTIDTVTDKNNKSTSVKASLDGMISVKAVETWLNLSLAPFASGTTLYKADLSLGSANQPIQVALTSNLKGIKIDFPSPYGKKVEEVRDLTINLTIPSDKPILSKIYYAKLLSAALSFTDSKTGLQFDRGQLYLGVGEAQLPNKPGLSIAARFKELNGKVLQQYLDMTHSKKSGKTAKATMQFDAGIFSNISVQADIVNLFGLHLNDAQFKVSKVNNNWIVDIKSTQAIGGLTIPTDLLHVQGKFQRLYLMSNGEKSQKINPQTIPGLSIIADDVRYESLLLGSVTLTTENYSNGIQIKELQIDTGGAKLNATGSWNGAKTQLQGNVVTGKASELLLRLGLNASALVAKDADAQFDLSWPGAPYDGALSGLSGTFSFKFGPGRIINLGNSTETKLGFGRLLNLLSLQSLPQHLSLNFNDVFEKGYSFNYMKGDYKLVNGNAFTDNMRVEGPLATVSLSGRLGLKAKDYNLLVSVMAHVTSSLPVIATVASSFNPIVGVATWAVGKVVSSQLNKVTTNYYQVTGPWDKPTWVQVSGSTKP